MNDPHATVEAWLSRVLEGDSQLVDLLPGGFHEGQGFDPPSGPFLVITWGTATPFHTFTHEALWTVFVQLSVQGVGVPSTELGAAMNRVHHLVSTQPLVAGVEAVKRTGAGRTLFASPLTGKRETQSTYKFTVHA